MGKRSYTMMPTRPSLYQRDGLVCPTVQQGRRIDTSPHTPIFYTEHSIIVLPSFKHLKENLFSLSNETVDIAFSNAIFCYRSFDWSA